MRCFNGKSTYTRGKAKSEILLRPYWSICNSMALLVGDESGLQRHVNNAPNANVQYIYELDDEVVSGLEAKHAELKLGENIKIIHDNLFLHDFEKNPVDGIDFDSQLTIRTYMSMDHTLTLDPLFKYAKKVVAVTCTSRDNRGVYGLRTYFGINNWETTNIVFEAFKKRYIDYSFQVFPYRGVGHTPMYHVVGVRKQFVNDVPKLGLRENHIFNRLCSKKDLEINKILGIPE